jgi:choline-sulfatase
MLFDLESDPDELLNLAEHPEHAALVRTFEAEMREHWEPAELRVAIVQSQRTRRYAFAALSQGRRTSWDYRPVAHGRYVGGDVDLSDLERARRFPPPAREQA